MGTKNTAPSGGEAASSNELAPKVERPIALHYLGDGSALSDVPARDIYADELADLLAHLVAQSERTATEDQPALTAKAARALLLDSGLYKE